MKKIPASRSAQKRCSEVLRIHTQRNEEIGYEEKGIDAQCHREVPGKKGFNEEKHSKASHDEEHSEVQASEVMRVYAVLPSVPRRFTPV